MLAAHDETYRYICFLFAGSHCVAHRTSVFLLAASVRIANQAVRTLKSCVVPDRMVDHLVPTLKKICLGLIGITDRTYPPLESA